MDMQLPIPFLPVPPFSYLPAFPPLLPVMAKRSGGGLKLLQ